MYIYCLMACYQEEVTSKMDRKVGVKMKDSYTPKKNEMNRFHLSYIICMKYVQWTHLHEHVKTNPINENTNNPWAFFLQKQTALFTAFPLKDLILFFFFIIFQILILVLKTINIYINIYLITTFEPSHIHFIWYFGRRWTFKHFQQSFDLANFELFY